MYRHSKAFPKGGDGDDDGILTHATLNACNKNAVCKATLDKDLHRMDKEKARLLREIDHEADLVRLHARDSSPSSASASNSRPVSAAARVSANHGHHPSPHPNPSQNSDARARSATTRRGSRIGSALSPRRGSVQTSSRRSSVSPSRSPQASLTRRSSTTTSQAAHSHSTDPPVHVNVTEPVTSSSQSVTAEDVLLLQNLRPTAIKVEHRDAPQSVPQIVVSDETNKPVGGDGEEPKKGSDPAREKDEQIPATLPSEHPMSNNSGSRNGLESPLSSSLNLPRGRPRSNSMPGNVILPSIFKPPQRRPSYCPSPPQASMDNLHVVESPRNRSSSFSGIVPVRRRGSISENWGSISERNRPEMGSFRGRRTSVDMGNMLRDLAYGVQHSELMHNDDKGKAVTQKQWDDLKKCRYLRMPSRDNSEDEEA